MGRRKKQKPQHPAGQPKARPSAGRADRQDERPRNHRLIFGVAAGFVVVIGAVAAWQLTSNEPGTTSVAAAPPLETPPPAPTVDTAVVTPSQTVTGSPRISFAEPAFDFGNVAQGAKPSHTFVFRNTGDAVLKVISARGT